MGQLTGGVPHAGNTYYIGLLPLAMFGYALFTERRPAFRGLAIGYGLLAALSYGGLFACLVYFLPGMPLCRHIGLVFGVANVFLIAAAGYGLDRLVCQLSHQPVAPRPEGPRQSRTVIVVLGCVLADLVLSRRGIDLEPWYVHPEWDSFFLFRVAVYLSLVPAFYMARRILPDRTAETGTPPARSLLWPALMLGLPFLIDVGSYRAQVFWTAPRIDPASIPPGLFHADRMPWLPTRSDEPADSRTRAAVELLGRELEHYHNVDYTVHSGFARIDPCRPLYRMDLLSRGVFDMISARGGKPLAQPHIGFLNLEDKAFLRSLGCHSPRLRLTPKAVFAGDEAEARSLFSSLPDPDSTVVLLASHPHDLPTAEHPSSERVGSVQLREFTANRLRAHVDVTSNSTVWLVYADAWHPRWRATVDGESVPVLRATWDSRPSRSRRGRMKWR